MKFAGLLAGVAALAIAVPAWAEITVTDAYARAAMPNAPTGAAFMILENSGAEDDRLVSVASDAAERVELHTHVDAGNGVMQMREVEEGFVVPAGGSRVLARGGDHVMFLGLKAPLVQGESVTVTLTFEKAGETVVEIPVDLERIDAHGGGNGMQHGAGHGGHGAGHGTMHGAGN